ncbi:30S ribosomal protein S16 [candidate division KSB1 bacterium]
MLKIRLARIGRKNDPSYRVVVTEHTRGPKSGDHIEVLGNYNPKVDNVALNGERVKYWISVGAQVSDTVHNILINQGIIEGKKINVLPKKSPIVKEAEETEAAAAPEASVEETKAEEAPVEEKKEVTEPEAQEKTTEEAPAVEDLPAGEAGKKEEA